MQLLLAAKQACPWIAQTHYRRRGKHKACRNLGAKGRLAAFHDSPQVQTVIRLVSFSARLHSHLDGALLSGGGDPLSVGAELDAVDLLAVALVGEDAALAPDVPQLEVRVVRAGREEVAVRVEVYAGQTWNGCVVSNNSFWPFIRTH